MSTRPFRAGLLLVAAMSVALAIACSGGGGKDAGSAQPQASSFGTPQPAAGAVQPSRSGSDAPAGARIVLARDQRLMLRSPNGGEQSLLRAPAGTFPTFPVWSPDGGRIAYVQAAVFSGQPNQDWGGDIYVVETSGGDPKLVWKHDQPGAQVQGLAWTPDGKALLLGYQLTLIKDNKYQGTVQRVEKLDVGSGARTPVVEGGFFPSLSRDGARMAYMTQDDTGKGGLWVSAPDGSGAKQLVELGPKWLAVLYPHIAPDGSSVAFAAVSGQATDMSPPRGDGGGLRAFFRSLLPQPVAAHGLPMDIWRVTTTDAAVSRLTNLSEDEPFPAWMPDGKTLAVLATNGLYEVQVDGGKVQKVGQGAFGGHIDVK